MNVSCKCYDFQLVFRSNAVSKLTEDFFESAALEAIAPPTPPDLSENRLTVVYFFLICLFIFFIYFFFVHKCLQLRSRQSTAISTYPTTPQFMVPQRKRVVRFKKGIRFECRAFEKEFNSSGREKYQGAINWVQEEFNKRFGTIDNGKPVVEVLKSAYAISVPMNNFKCGKTCIEFLPVSGQPAHGYLTYQMCGLNTIQIVRYTEKYDTYIAGFCIYIPQPYADGCYYQSIHIDSCYTGREYIPKSPLFEAPEHYEPNHPEELKNFKLHFCQKLEQVVAAGFVDGQVKHITWVKSTESYEASDCSSCRGDKLEDNPPPYHLLEV